jgi:uroporphyrinogen decarboxylase
MTGKEILYKVLRHETVPRPAWIPFAGVHAGKLKGYDATEVYSDADRLFESLMEVNKVYSPDGQVLLFDLQLEAEILGCKIEWSPKSPPCVMDSPLEESDEIPKRLLQKTEGRLPLVIEVARRMKKAIGDKTALYGLFCGPFTLASHLRGTQLFKQIRKDPDYVHKILDYTTQISLQMCQLYMDEGIDVIVPVDPVVSQVSPAHFENFLLEPYKKIFDFIRSKGAFSSFFVCGNATGAIIFRSMNIQRLTCMVK